MYTQICSIHHMIKDKGNTEHLSNNQNTNEWGMGVSKGVSREQMSRNRGCPSTDVLEQGLPLYLMSYGTLSRVQRRKGQNMSWVSLSLDEEKALTCLNLSETNQVKYSFIRLHGILRVIYLACLIINSLKIILIVSLENLGKSSIKQ